MWFALGISRLANDASFNDELLSVSGLFLLFMTNGRFRMIISIRRRLSDYINDKNSYQRLLHKYIRC